MAEDCIPSLLSLGPDLVQRIAMFTTHNDVAAGLRPACKTTAQIFQGSNAKLLLSEPITHTLFKERWDSPEAWRGLPLKQRLRLVSKVAASGVIKNLELAVRRADCKVGYEPLKSAAGAGRLEACSWLLANVHAGERLDLASVLCSAALGGSIDVCKLLLETAKAGGTADGRVPDASLAGSGAVQAAAAAGRKELAAWLLDNGATWSPQAPGFAARWGHWALTEWLLQLHHEHPATRPVCYTELSYGAAAGCDLSTLQRAHALKLANAPLPPRGFLEVTVDLLDWLLDHVTAAATSTTPDWQAKVAWLISPTPGGAGLEPVCDDSVWYLLPDHEALDRVQWLLASACVKVSPSCHTAERCAAQGSTACLKKLMELGAHIGEGAALRAAERGDIAVLQLLLEHGCPMPPRRLMCEAAQAGRLDVLQWLVGVLGPEGLQPWAADEGVLAKGFGGRGRYPGEAPARNVVEVAVAAGHVAVAEWLVQAVEEQQQQQAALGEQGGQQVPQEQALGQEGRAGLVIPQHLMTGAALSGRLDTVRWLRGRGCALDGGVFDAAVRAGNVELVEWLASEGCPMSVSGAGVQLGKPGVLRIGELALRVDLGGGRAIGCGEAGHAAVCATAFARLCTWARGFCCMRSTVVVCTSAF